MGYLERMSYANDNNSMPRSPLPLLGRLPLDSRAFQSSGRAHLVPAKGGGKETCQEDGTVGVLLGEADAGIPATPVLDHPDSGEQEFPANALAAVIDVRGPGANDALATAEAGAAVAAPALGGRAWRAAVGLEMEHEGADEITSAAGANHDDLVALGPEPR